MPGPVNARVALELDEPRFMEMLLATLGMRRTKGGIP
jgi:hypothetical protein